MKRVAIFAAGLLLVSAIAILYIMERDRGTVPGHQGSAPSSLNPYGTDSNKDKADAALKLADHYRKMADAALAKAEENKNDPSGRKLFSETIRIAYPEHNPDDNDGLLHRHGEEGGDIFVFENGTFIKDGEPKEEGTWSYKDL